MSKLVEMCADLVRKNLKTIEEVPEWLKTEVQALINEEV